MSDTAGTFIKLGVFAFALTAITSGVWGGLLVTNLRGSPRVPWSVAVMGGVLWIVWTYLSGRRGNAATSADRRARLRAREVSPPVFRWAALAGMLSIVSLTGLWIALSQVVHARGNALPDFSRYSLLVVVLVVAMGAFAGASTEEAGFRGYLQGALEVRFGAPLAIVITALAMLPAHGLTQGFGVTTVVFYVCVDGMLGLMAYLTQSIVPGVAVHFIGLVVFFSLIWPFDATRRFVGTEGPDGWFWIHVGQAVLCAVLALLAFRHLALMTAPLRRQPMADAMRSSADSS